MLSSKSEASAPLAIAGSCRDLSRPESFCSHCNIRTWPHRKQGSIAHYLGRLVTSGLTMKTPVCIWKKAITKYIVMTSPPRYCTSGLRFDTTTKFQISANRYKYRWVHFYLLPIILVICCRYGYLRWDQTNQFYDESRPGGDIQQHT